MAWLEEFYGQGPFFDSRLLAEVVHLGPRKRTLKCPKMAAFSAILPSCALHGVFPQYGDRRGARSQRFAAGKRELLGLLRPGACRPEHPLNEPPVRCFK